MSLILLVLVVLVNPVSMAPISDSVELSAEPPGVLISGESLKLVCLVTTSAESSKSPILTFSVDSKVVKSIIISSGTGVYSHRIYSITPKHSGRYRCGVKQSSGELRESPDVLITVMDRFTSVTLSVTPDVVLNEGQSFQLKCDAEINSLLEDKMKNVQTTFTFLRDETSLITDSKCNSYTIARAEACHTGRYSCVAVSGNAKQTSHEIMISVKEDQTALIAASIVLALLLFVPPAVFFISRSIIRWRQSKNSLSGFESCQSIRVVVQNI